MIDSGRTVVEYESSPAAGTDGNRSKITYLSVVSVGRADGGAEVGDEAVELSAPHSGTAGTARDAGLPFRRSVRLA